MAFAFRSGSQRGMKPSAAMSATMIPAKLATIAHLDFVTHEPGFAGCGGDFEDHLPKALMERRRESIA